MTKIEMKLSQLGYERKKPYPYGEGTNFTQRVRFMHDANRFATYNKIIVYDITQNKIVDYYIVLKKELRTQEEIDKLQILFNNIKRDVKIALED